MHVRRSDFVDWCDADVTVEECLPQLSAFALRVQEVKEELKKRGMASLAPGSEFDDLRRETEGQRSGEGAWDVKHVLITSDEPLMDPANPGEQNPFWTQVFSYGWVTMDYAKEKTAEKYGP